MFNTYEELKEKFPIGTVYRRSEEIYKHHYYNNEDINIYKKMYDKVVVISHKTCTCVRYNEYKVDGYLFDGTGWYPAKQTWDGWEPIIEDEINVLGGF